MGKSYEISKELLIMPHPKKIIVFSFIVEQSRKLSLLLGDPLPLLIMFAFDVEITKTLIQSFGLEHHLDFHNTIIASGKTDPKKIIPGDNL